MGSACFARGNDRNLALLQKYIAEKKLDARIELSGGRCEGRCGAGPNIYVDGVCHSGMSLKLVIGFVLIFSAVLTCETKLGFLKHREKLEETI